jgi:hypothetical protein
MRVFLRRFTSAGRTWRAIASAGNGKGPRVRRRNGSDRGQGGCFGEPLHSPRSVDVVLAGTRTRNALGS